MKIKRAIAAVLAFTACLSFAACNSDTTTASTTSGNTQANSETAISGIDIKELCEGYANGTELLQNDYRGGIMRSDVVKNAVLKTIDTSKQGNVTIRSDNPNSYWTAEGYQDFVANFFSTPIINDTQWFNEEETDFATVINQMGIVSNSFTVADSDGVYSFSTPNIVIKRNEKDDYTISGLYSDYGTTTSSYPLSYRILYDCDKDWCKAVASINLNVEQIKNNITVGLFEYARLDNDTFAIQTETERLVAIFEPTKTDMDIRERTLKEFYYSRLAVDCKRTDFKEFEPLPEVDENEAFSTANSQTNRVMETYPNLNQQGEQASYYGSTNSIFLEDKANINKNWVFRDKALQQAISYIDGNLIVVNYNKLAEKYEQFIYYKDSAPSEDKIKGIIDVDSLVGTNNKPKEQNKVETNSAPVSSKQETSQETPTATTTSNKPVNSIPERAESEVVDMPTEESE